MEILFISCVTIWSVFQNPVTQVYEMIYGRAKEYSMVLPNIDQIYIEFMKTSKHNFHNLYIHISLHTY